MPAPFEVIAGAAEVYVAEVGTPFPEIDAAPGVGWTLVGTGGSERYSEAGVRVSRALTQTDINALGTTTPIKNVITATGFTIEVDVMDATLEQLALAFGADPDGIETTAAGAGVAGVKRFDIPTDPVPFQRAVLVRVNQSPYIEGGNLQFELFAANQIGNAAGAFTKGDAFQVTHIWSAVKTAEGFVSVAAQTAQPTS